MDSWSQEGLSLAASMVGRPLSCDAQTYNCQRLEFARLCVEIDATLPKVTSFEVVSPLSLEPITVEVEYEWLPSHCASCKTYGHSCKRSNKPAPTNDELHLTMVQPSSTSLPNTDPAPPNTLPSQTPHQSITQEKTQSPMGTPPPHHTLNPQKAKFVCNQI